MAKYTWKSGENFSSLTKIEDEEYKYKMVVPAGSILKGWIETNDDGNLANFELPFNNINLDKFKKKYFKLPVSNCYDYVGNKIFSIEENEVVKDYKKAFCQLQKGIYEEYEPVGDFYEQSENYNNIINFNSLKDFELIVESVNFIDKDSINLFIKEKGSDYNWSTQVSYDIIKEEFEHPWHKITLKTNLNKLLLDLISLKIINVPNSQYYIRNVFDSNNVFRLISFGEYEFSFYKQEYAGCIKGWRVELFGYNHDTGITEKFPYSDDIFRIDNITTSSITIRAESETAYEYLQNTWAKNHTITNIQLIEPAEQKYNIYATYNSYNYQKIKKEDNFIVKVDNFEKDKELSQLFYNEQIENFITDYVDMQKKAEYFLNMVNWIEWPDENNIYFIIGSEKTYIKEKNIKRICDNTVLSLQTQKHHWDAFGYNYKLNDTELKEIKTKGFISDTENEYKYKELTLILDEDLEIYLGD